MNDQDRHPHQSFSSSSTHNIPKREPGCICLEPRRHAKDRALSHGSQVERITLIPPYLTEEESVCLGARQGYSGRSSQMAGGRIHKRSILSQLAGQCSDGQESQQKVEDVCRLHGLK